MTEDNIDLQERGVNAEQISDYLTYISSSGEISLEANQIADLWQCVAVTFHEQINKRGPSFEIKTNRYGASHIIDKSGEQVHSPESKAMLFFKAADSLVFGERFSNEGIEIVSENGKQRHFSYGKLVENPDASSEIKGRKIKTRIEYRDSENKPTGTSLVVNENEMNIFQKVKNNGNDEDVLVLQIKGDPKSNKTEICMMVDTESGSRVMAKTDSSKVFWKIREGLILGNVYPYPQSVSEFMRKLRNEDIDKVLGGGELDDLI